MPLITPPEFQPLRPSEPLVFLFGPRRGGDWENPTAKWFLDHEANLCVASTRGDEWSEFLSEVQRRRCKKIQKEWVVDLINLSLERMVNRKKGDAKAAIFIWCPKEEVVDPTRNYAPASRIVIGKIAGWINGAKGMNVIDSDVGKELPDGLFIGADPDFGGRRDLEIALELDERPLYSSLEEMRRDVLRYLRESDEETDE